MRIIIIRHGEKQPVSGFPETKWPLQPFAREQVKALREELERLGFVPAYCLCSRWQHATETAEILAADTKRVITVTGLTPHTDDPFFTLQAMLAEAAEQGAMIAESSTVGFVGHHPRTGKLAEALTGTEPPELARPEALILAEASLAALEGGKSWIERRCSGQRPNAPRRP